MVQPHVIDAPLPQWFNFEISSRCNLHCPYCATGRGDIPPEDRGIMTPEVFAALFEKIRPHAEAVQLFNWGEPFMNRHCLDFVETISAAGMISQISTNLTVRRFDEAETERIACSGLTSLLASIDGITQPAYEAYRRNGSVEKALANLEDLIAAKRRLGVGPHLIWAYHVNRHNQHEVDAARRMARRLGVTIWFKQLSCPPEFQTDLLRTRPRLFAPPPELPELWQGRSNRGLGSFRIDPRLPQTCNVCRMPFEILMVNVNGDVYPCSAVTGRQFVVGNLLRDSLEDIWHRRMAVNRRQLIHLRGTFPAAQCRRCKHFPTDLDAPPALSPSADICAL